MNIQKMNIQKMTLKGAEKPLKSRAPITWAVSAPGEGSFFCDKTAH